jgi:hypothetical protein
MKIETLFLLFKIFEKISAEVPLSKDERFMLRNEGITEDELMSSTLQTEVVV